MKIVRWVGILSILGLAIAGYIFRNAWLPGSTTVTPREHDEDHDHGEAATFVLLSDQAITNLGLSAKRLTPTTHWKSIFIPGIIVDRPGFSDRGLVAPATGIVTRIERFPGESVKPGEPLFRIKLLSESLHLTQTELFKTTQDIRLAETQRKRLASSGTVAESRLIEVDNQLTRLEVASKAYRQELLNRGISAEQITGVAAGEFVNEITISVPNRPANSTRTFGYEIQELKTELGQQVQAGQALCLLADHEALAIEGRAFRDETTQLEKSVREKWPVEIDFQEDPASSWKPLPGPFYIQFLANSIDPLNRTFAFRIPLENESREVVSPTNTQRLWRFRPGQKVRILVKTELLTNVFVLPTEATSRDGFETVVFTQNVNQFYRKVVKPVFQDRQFTAIANDGSIEPGEYLVQRGAAQLNRLTKTSQSSVPKGYHMHADGSLHKNGDDEK